MSPRRWVTARVRLPHLSSRGCPRIHRPSRRRLTGGRTLAVAALVVLRYPELDVVYEMNSRLDFYRISFPGDYDVRVDAFGFDSPIPGDTWIPHHWQDQFSIRLGGDYNIMPGLAAIRAGVSFETRGVNVDFPTIDFWPYQRFGGHVGLTLRAGNLDINLAYALIVQESLTVEGGQLRQTIATCTTCPAGMQLDPLARTQNGGDVIADGTYTSSYHHIALGVNYRFGGRTSQSGPGRIRRLSHFEARAMRSGN